MTCTHTNKKEKKKKHLNMEQNELNFLDDDILAL